MNIFPRSIEDVITERIWEEKWNKLREYIKVKVKEITHSNWFPCNEPYISLPWFEKWLTANEKFLPSKVDKIRELYWKQIPNITQIEKLKSFIESLRDSWINLYTILFWVFWMIEGQAYFIEWKKWYFGRQLSWLIWNKDNWYKLILSNWEVSITPAANDEKLFYRIQA